MRHLLAFDATFIGQKIAFEIDGKSHFNIAFAEETIKNIFPDVVKSAGFGVANPIN